MPSRHDGLVCSRPCGRLEGIQSEHVERLIDLAMTTRGFGSASKPISNLSLYKLRELQGKIETVLEESDRVDAYTVAHLAEANDRISHALEAPLFPAVADFDADGQNLGVATWYDGVAILMGTATGPLVPSSAMKRTRWCGTSPSAILTRTTCRTSFTSA